MELNAVHTRIFSKSKESNISAEPENDLGKSTSLGAITLETALEILKSKPNHDQLTQILQWLLKTRKISPPPSNTIPIASNTSDLKFSDPLIGQITNILVSEIVPAFWSPAEHSLSPNEQYGKPRSLLIKCLRSVPGLRALTNNLRQQLDRTREPRSTRGPNENPQGDGRRLILLTEVLEGVLKGDRILAGIWRDINAAAATDAYDSTTLNTNTADSRAIEGEKQPVSLMWNDLLALLKGGKLVSAIAEADRVAAGLGRDECSWVGDGEKYGSWLGRNVWFMALRGGEEELKAAASVLGNALTLGYKGEDFYAADSYAQQREGCSFTELTVSQMPL